MDCCCDERYAAHDKAIGELELWKRRLRRVVIGLIITSVTSAGAVVGAVYHVAFKRGSAEMKLEAVEARTDALEVQVSALWSAMVQAKGAP